MGGGWPLLVVYGRVGGVIGSVKSSGDMRDARIVRYVHRIVLIWVHRVRVRLANVDREGKRLPWWSC